MGMSELGVVVYGGSHWAWTVENMLQRQRSEIGEGFQEWEKSQPRQEPLGLLWGADPVTQAQGLWFSPGHPKRLQGPGKGFKQL